MTVVRLAAPVVFLVLAVAMFAAGLYIPAAVALAATALVLVATLQRDDRANR